MGWSWLFFGALALVVAAYILYEVFTRRLKRAGSPHALLISAYRKSFEKAERRRRAKRERLLEQAHVLEDILEARPAETSVRESLIKLYLAETKVESLKKHTLEMLRHHPKNSLAFSTSVALAREDDFFRDAREIFKSAVEQSPNDPVLLQHYVNFILGRPNYLPPDQRASIIAEAESLIAELLESSPEGPGALWSHAVLLQHKGEMEQAAAELSKVPSPQASLLLQLGEIFTKLNKPDEAAKAYRRAAETEVESLNGVGAIANIAYCKLGLIDLQNGDEGAAANRLRDAMPVTPRVSFWRDGLDMELAAELLQRGLAVNEVKEYVNIALAYRPDDQKTKELSLRLSAMD
jgi:predicted Zn-dependent protease